MMNPKASRGNMVTIDQELKGEFSFLKLKEYPNISADEFVHSVLYALNYEKGKYFAFKINDIIKRFKKNKDKIIDSCIVDGKHNNIILSLFLEQTLLVMEREVVITKEEVKIFENKLDDEECSEYMHCINRIMGFLTTHVLN